MKKSKQVQRIMSFLLSIILTLSNVSLVRAAGWDTAPYILLNASDFEDGSTWGFAGTANPIIESDDKGQYLKTGVVNQSGGRSAIKTFQEPISDSEILITFDWKPSDVSTGANSSEVLFRDQHDNPIFRLVKQGGVGGAIRYGVGTTGTELVQTEVVSGISTDGSWLSAKVRFDFVNETVSLQVYDRDKDVNQFSISDISLQSINYVKNIASIGIMGNRASGQALTFETAVDNFFLYSSGVPAPPLQDRKIVWIATEYDAHIEVQSGASKEEVISILPQEMDVRLENGVVRRLEVSWESEDYQGQQPGAYTFKGILLLDGVQGVSNPDQIQAVVAVQVLKTAEIPAVEGYEGVYYTDFGDIVPVTPAYWGFTTANATLSIQEGDVGGNTTPKLQFSIVNQSGGRVATRFLPSVVNGDQILVKFDWYPGLLNDKGSNPNENGGEFRIFDSANNTVLTLNNTRNAPLKFFAGMQAAVVTAFTDPNAWYEIQVLLDVVRNQAKVTITDQANGQTEKYEIDLDGVSFNGTVAALRLGGVRTSGNNITWTTYVDNLGVYNVPIAGNRISVVNKLPYHRVYVGAATEEVSTIGLPQSVAVTLADGTETVVDIAEWKTVGQQWNPSQQGIYQFQGLLTDSEEVDNGFGRAALCYVYNRLPSMEKERQTEWLDRGAVALQSEAGMFISWRLLADEYAENIQFHLYRNGQKITNAPLAVTNYIDTEGAPGDTYRVETLLKGISVETYETKALETDYLSIPMQKPEGGITATGAYTYNVNDISVGDLTGDGQYEVIVKWYPSNAIDSSQTGMTGPTIFDAYKLDGTPLWRIHMGLNLTSGAHYHQFLVFDFDGNGKSEFLIKTADATTVYGVTDGVFDEEKVISVIGNPEDNGKWVNNSGKVFGGPEYISVFQGETGEVIDTIDFRFGLSVPGSEVETWGDNWHNRSDRWLAGVAYLDGVAPSALYSRGYYERTTYVAYDLVEGKLQERWYFDSKETGIGGGMGFHSLATADLDNDGCDEIIAGSLVLDQDGSILYVMDGEMGREKGSHGDALHVGAFDPKREGIHIIAVHEDPAVASLEYHDGATGETLRSFYAAKDAGRGMAANITSQPGFEYWGTAGFDVESGGGIYNVQGSVVGDSFRDAGLSVNFKAYWTGDLLNELLDGVMITKYNEATGKAELIRDFGLEGVVSNNGTKANPSLQADIFGDWREEVVYPTADSTELRIYSTTIPTEYRIYTLMHDTVYRMAVAWQNVGYNQPPHLSFYLGEDIRDTVLHGELKVPKVAYTNKPEKEPVETPRDNGDSGTGGGGADTSSSTSTSTSTPVRTVMVNGKTYRWDTGGMAKGQVILEVQDKDVVEGKVDIGLPIGLMEELMKSEPNGNIEIRTSFGSYYVPVNFPDTIQGFQEFLQANNLIQKDLVIRISIEDRSDDPVLDKVLQQFNEAGRLLGAVRYQILIADGKTGKEYQVANRFNQRIRRGLPLNDVTEITASMAGMRYNKETGSLEFIPHYFERVDGIWWMFIDSSSNSDYLAVENEVGFEDVKNHWGRSYIEAAASKGLVHGVGADKYDPDREITRAEFVKMLVNALDLSENIGKVDPYLDLDPNAWYYQDVMEAKKAGLLSGLADLYFEPAAIITREEMAYLLGEVIKREGAEEILEISGLSRFKDREEIRAEYAESMALAVDKKILLGMGDGTLSPKGTATRAQAAAIVIRLLKEIRYIS